MPISRVVLGLTLAGVLTGAACTGGDAEGLGGAFVDPSAAGQGNDWVPFFAGGEGALLTSTGADGVQLDWDAPPTTDEVAIVRAYALVKGSPEALALGEDLLFRGRATSFVDRDDPLPGRLHYTLFARPPGGTWSGIATAAMNVPMPSQTGTLVVTLAPSPHVSVTVQPPHLTLAGTATYDAGAQTLDVDVAITNGAARIVHNPKLELVGATEGTLTADGRLHGRPFRSYGPASLDVGAVVTRTLHFTDVTGATDPIVLSVELTDAPLLIVGNDFAAQGAYQLVDTSTMTQVGDVPCDELLYEGNGSGHCAQRPGAIAGDGAFLYTGHRSLPIVRQISLATQTVTLAVSIDDGLGHVDNVAAAPDGSALYAVLNVGAHATGNGNVGGSAPAAKLVEVVRLDPDTLAETGRLTIATSSTLTELRGRRLAISPDGTQAALPVLAEGKVHLIDLASFTETTSFDVNDAWPDAKQVAWSPDGGTLYVSFRYGDRLARIDVASEEVTPLVLEAEGSSTGGIAVGADGQVWIANGRSETTGATSTLSLLSTGPVECGTLDTAGRPTDSILFGSRGRAYVSIQGTSIMVFDAATHLRIDADSDGWNGTNDIALTRRAGQHWMLETPF